MIHTIRVDNIEHKKTKTNRDFWNLQSGADKYYIWEHEIAQSLFENIGKTFEVEVDIQGDKKFKTIKGILGLAGGQTSLPASPKASISEVKKDNSDQIILSVIYKGVVDMVCNDKVVVEDMWLKVISDFQKFKEALKK